MDLYIDYANLKSFVDSRHKENFNDCQRMMKRQLHIVFNMDRSVLKSDPILSQWVLTIGSGKGNSEETDTFKTNPFPNRPVKSNMPTEWNRQQLSSVYLINDVDSPKLKSRGTVLLGEVGEELSVLSQLFCGKDYEYHHLYDIQKNFNSWEQLAIDHQLLPCTDIVINDRYLFKNEKSLVKYNLNGILRVLVESVKNKLNIVLFTINKTLIEFDVDEAKKIIKSSIENVTGVKPNITFVTSNDSSLIPHDRFIITNYRLIRSGDSFVYFDTNGNKITNGGSLDVDSLANFETYIFVESLLEKLQRSYAKINERNSDMIIGTKVSKFITF